MNWNQLDSHILRSANPSGYTVERFRSHVPPFGTRYMAYGPRHKSGAINILGNASSGPEARALCEDAHRSHSTRQRPKANQPKASDL